MKRFAVTGAAIVSPLGKTKERDWRAAERDAPVLHELTRFSSAQKIICGDIKGFDPDDHISDRRFRRAALISQYALAAIAEALGCVSTETSRETALLMAVTHGALCYTQSFHRDLIEGGPDAVSPIHFSDSVLNAPAGNASICFGIRGPVHTVLGGGEATIKAMMEACRMLTKGDVGRVIVAAAEELNELSISAYERKGITALSEGAGAVVIERAEDIGQTAPLCSIIGIASLCDPCNPEAALNDALNSCVADAGISASDIDLVFSDKKGFCYKPLKGVPLIDLSLLAGQAFVASTLWETAFAAMALDKGAIPQSIIGNGILPPERINNVLVCTADKQGNAAAVILSRYA